MKKVISPDGDSEYNEDDYEDVEDEDEVVLDWECPNCHREYDEIDYEFQICHICKFNNRK